MDKAAPRSSAQPETLPFYLLDELVCCLSPLLPMTIFPTLRLKGEANVLPHRHPCCCLPCTSSSKSTLYQFRKQRRRMTGSPNVKVMFWCQCLSCRWMVSVSMCHCQCSSVIMVLEGSDGGFVPWWNSSHWKEWQLGGGEIWVLLSIKAWFHSETCSLKSTHQMLLITLEHLCFIVSVSQTNQTLICFWKISA